MNSPIISIVIATYNSSRTLESVLKSVKNQSFDQKKIEILAVDGGSSDKTIQIAKKYRCRVIPNPKVEPVNARLIGIKQAKGKYIVFIDADEVMANSDSLKIKVSMFSQKNVRAVIGTGYQNPPNSPIIRKYINEFGDPFSYFVYRLSKNHEFFIQEMKKKYFVLKEDGNSIEFDFSQTTQFPIIELGAANSMVDLRYLKKEFPNFNSEVFAHMFYLFNKKSQKILITKRDPVVHFSSDTLKGYFKKIQWRTKNNIFHIKSMGISGYSGREKYHGSKNTFKKYLFIPYAFSFLFPIWDALALSISRNDIRFFIHVFLCFYTAILICINYIKKIIGFNPQLKNYDESKVVVKGN